MSECYWYGEACRDGHVGACPARDGDPWSETTRPSATPMPPAEDEHEPTSPQAIYDGTAAALGQCWGPEGERWTWDARNQRWVRDLA